MTRRVKELRAALVGLLAVTCLTSVAAAEKAVKPNIVVISGDDIGWFPQGNPAGGAGSPGFRCKPEKCIFWKRATTYEETAEPSLFISPPCR